MSSSFSVLTNGCPKGGWIQPQWAPLLFVLTVDAIVISDFGLLALPNEGVPVAKLSSRYPSFAICRQHNIQYGGISEGGQKPFQAVGLIESLFEP